jgi:hypothetical protein
MNTREMLENLKHLVLKRSPETKDEIQRLCRDLNSAHHAKFFLADGQEFRKWQEHLSNITTFAKHPSYESKARGAISALFSGLPADGEENL